jgi:hypothetical protein
VRFRQLAILGSIALAILGLVTIGRLVITAVLNGNASAGANAAAVTKHPSSDMACTWIDGPHISADGRRCYGAVHCRHPNVYTFIPFVGKVSCAVTSDACRAERRVGFPFVCETERSGQ